MEASSWILHTIYLTENVLIYSFYLTNACILNNYHITALNNFSVYLESLKSKHPF